MTNSAIREVNRQYTIVENKRKNSKKAHSNFNSSSAHSKSRNHQGKNDVNIVKKNTELPDIKKLEKDVLHCIIGQDLQVRQIITSIYRAKTFRSIKSNVLVIGKSGTGKTATIVEVAKRLHIPYTIEDATKYTQEGYVGANVDEMLRNLIESAKGDIKKAQEGILIIDEIDKKTGKETYNERDISGSEVLKSLLKIIEGGTIKLNIGDKLCEEFIDFNTKNITVIFLGAFSGLDKIREKRLKVKQLGFSIEQKSSVEEQRTKFTKQDLVSYGMPEEFVGRIDTIIEMKELTKEDLVLILKNSRLSIFRKYLNELRKIGISLVYDEELFSLIAEESLGLDTGARELSNTVNRIFENISYDIFSNKNSYTKCVLSLDIVKDNTKYELS